MSEQKSPEVFRKLMKFMALMDSFHDFAQGDRVPGGPIDKRELFRLLNNGKNTKKGLKSKSYSGDTGIDVESNEYFSKGFIGNNTLFKDKVKEEMGNLTKGLASRGPGVFEEGITRFLDGEWPDNDEGKLGSEFIVPNSLYWSKWALESHYDEIEESCQNNGYWSMSETDPSYTGNRSKLIIWKKDDMAAFEKIINQELVKIFGPDRELVFDYSAFNSKITKKLEENGYIFKVSDSTMWDPATRKDATLGDDGELIINSKPTSSNKNKYIYNNQYPYDDEQIKEAADNALFNNHAIQFCSQSRIRLLGIKNGKGIGEIYHNKPIDFRKGRSVSQLGKFIRAQQNRRKKLLEDKQAKINSELETMFIDELTEEETKIGNFEPDEYNCNALDMKRSGDWGQVAYAKEYGGIFYSGDRMAIMYAIIQKCPYIFTGSILNIGNAKYSRMIIDQGVFDPKKFLLNEIDNIYFYYKNNLEILNKISNCIDGVDNHPFNVLSSKIKTILDNFKLSIENNYKTVDTDKSKELKFTKYLTKFGGKIIKYFEMICFIETSKELGNDEHNLGLKLSNRIGEDESIFKNVVNKYYSLDFSHFNLRNKDVILNNFKKLNQSITPGLNYDNELDSIDSLLPEIFDWTSSIGGTNINNEYKIVLNYNDELLYDKLKTLFFYFNNEEKDRYTIPLYSSDEDDENFDAANILIAIIKSDYSEITKLLDNISKFSNYDIINALHYNRAELLGKMLDSDNLGLLTIYNNSSKINTLLKYEIYNTNMTPKIYSEFISYYIHKYIYMPIYIIPFLLEKIKVPVRGSKSENIIDNIFKIKKISGKAPPDYTLGTVENISIWQNYFKRNDALNDKPFFRIGANPKKSDSSELGKKWFGELNIENKKINLINEQGSYQQHNQLSLLYAIVSYIVKSSHCDIHDCTKDEDLNIFHNSLTSNQKEGFYYGINNTLYKMRNKNKNKLITKRYISTIKGLIDTSNPNLNLEGITKLIDDQNKYLGENGINELNFDTELEQIDSTIEILKNNSNIFYEDDYSRIIIPEERAQDLIDLYERNIVYHLVIIEFLKILREAYVLKSEHSNLTNDEEKFYWINCDDKIKLSKLAIYSIICHMPKRFSAVGNNTLLKIIYDEFEEGDTDFSECDEICSPRNSELREKLNDINTQFTEIISNIYNRQIIYINSISTYNSQFSSMVDKIHNKLKTIHFIHSAFNYRNYYRNFKLVNKIAEDVALNNGECSNIEDDFNIFSNENNIDKIIKLCNNGSDILNYGQTNTGQAGLNISPREADQKLSACNSEIINNNLPKINTDVMVEWENKDGSLEFYTGKVIKVNKKSFRVRYEDKALYTHKIGEKWKCINNQKAGGPSIENLTNLLMKNDITKYIQNVTNTVSDKTNIGKVFDKLTDVTKVCVKNFYKNSN